jgi:outer membrane usher protein
MLLRRRMMAALLVASIAPALPAQSSPEAFAEAVVSLRINGQAVATTLVVRRDTDGTLLLRAADLADLRLRPPTTGAVMVNGERYYRMGVDNAAVASFDDATQTFELTLPAAAFVASYSRASASVDAARITPSAPGAFVNYDVSVEQGLERQAGGLFELGAFGRHGVAIGTLVARHDAAGERSLIRLDTAWTRDFPDRLATLRVGDAISTPASWGRAVRFGGLQYGTNFSTQPTLVTTPLLAAQGEAVVPSTVDVFVNGRQIASEAVPPGPFTIDHLPVLTGAGQLQVVVTDVLGREQVIVQPYYSGTALLRSGLSEFSFELGSIRQDYGSSSSAYGDVLGAATIRRGLNDTVTAGLHAEAQRHGSYAVGVDAALQAGLLGIVTAQAATGGDADDSGWLAGLGVEHNGPHLTAYLQTQFTSRTFSQPGGSLLESAPRQRTFGGIGFNFAASGSLQMAYGLQSFHDAPSVETIGLSYSLSLHDYGYLGVFATSTTSGAADASVLLTWTMPLGDRRSVSAALQYTPAQAGGGGEFEAVTSAQRNLPSGSGVGYNIAVSTADEQDLGVAYQGRAGVVAIDYARRGDSSGVRASAAGGVAVTAAGVMPARRLDQSFAVVQVADYADLSVFVDNQPIGKTDSKGRVLVDSLRPYERNEISLDPTQVPMDGAIAQSAIGITPAYRSGALVRFPVTRASAATVRLVQRDGTPVPAGATARLNGAGTEFPIALDGLLYVEGLQGSMDAQVVWKAGQCRASLHRPTGVDPIPDLGTVPCD